MNISHRKEEEKINHEFEKDLLKIVNSLPVCISYFDKEQRYQFNNKIYEEWFGLACEKIRGRHVREVLGEKTYESVRGHVEKALSGQRVSYQAELANKDGGIRFVEADLIPHFDDNGDIEGCSVQVKDITERKRTEETMRMTQFSVDHSLDRIVWVAPDGHILFANEAVCKETGYSREEVLSMSVSDVDPNYPAERWAELYKEIKKRGHMRFETRNLGKDGQLQFIEICANHLEFDGKEFICSFGRDITERKRAEERLQESEERCRTLVQHAPDGIFLVDATTGRFLDCNQQGLEMFGYTREEMLSFTPVDFSPPLAPDGRPVPEVLQERLKSLIPGQQITFEWVHLHADGHEVPCEIRAVLLPSADRRVLRASMIDISGRKRTEEARKERMRFQKLVSGIATKFTGLVGDELKQAIQDSLAEIGRYFEVDAVRLYRLSPQGDIIVMRNVWSSGPPASEGETAEMHKMKYPHLAAHYSRGEPILYGCPDECPPLPDLRKILNYANIQAGVGVPLEIDDSGVDVFALARTQSEHVWPENILQSAEVIGKIILGAMLRREAETKLFDSYNEIKLLKERLEVENIYLRDQMSVQSTHKDIIGKSDAVKYVLYKIKQVAPSDATVLIHGETGTGKELVAEAVHSESARRNRHLIKVNCAALPSNLIESELFGREKGAFTGSQARQIGRFELADKGTIFLDEVGELPLELQAKLLRVIQSGEFERLGSPHTISVDVRIIASTNRNLIEEVKNGRFREDLYYRLNVFPITVPPLRERKEDIPMIVNFFLKKFGKKIGKQIERVPYEVIKALQEYRWPGNVRELENIVERSMIISPNATLHLADDPETLKAADHGSSQSNNLSEVERDHILHVLEQAKWKIEGKNGAAEVLDLNPSTLRTRMRKLGIKKSVS